MLTHIKIMKIDKDLETPTRAYEDDAGLDLLSAITVVIKPGHRVLIPSGVAVEIPVGYAGFVQPRSGLAIDHGIGLVNSPGLIDSSYRGEIKVIMINMDPRESFRIKRGDKIAQLVIKKIETPKVLVVDSLNKSDRGTNGFGSSGISS